MDLQALFEKNKARNEQEEFTADETVITARDGQQFAIPKNDPNYDLLCKFAQDVDTRRNMHKVGIPEEKQVEYYLKFKIPNTDHLATTDERCITEQERIALEAKPSCTGLGTGKRGEELHELVRKFHRTTE